MKLDGDRGAVLAAEAKAKGMAVRQAKAQTRASDLAPIVEDIRASGATTLQAMAYALNAKGIPTARGETWALSRVQRILGRAT